MRSNRVTPIRGSNTVAEWHTPPTMPEEAAFDDVLADLGASLDSVSSADRWLDRAIRAVAERLEVDRVELFRRTLIDGELKLDHGWPPSGGMQRVDLERPGLFPWILERVRAGRIVVVPNCDIFPEAAAVDRRSCEDAGVGSLLAIPLRVQEERCGVLVLSASRASSWSERVVSRVQGVAQAAAAMLAFCRSRTALASACAENERPRDRLDGDTLPRPELGWRSEHREIVGRSAAITRILQQVDQVAPTASTVLIVGETGTGKELVAHAIHEASERRNRPFIKVNCAALPTTLVESELFGREKGAYTGALSRQAGRFELADGGTIFLDEIAELAPEVQVKLLRVLQGGEFERLGGTTTQKVNIRVIAATNRDLAKAVREGRFREDLYYRLNVFQIRVPPLRDRREDVPMLVWTFVQEFALGMGRQVDRISRRSMDSLQVYSWPGNVRELRNVVERAMIVHAGPILNVEIPEAERSEVPANLSLEEVERRHLSAVLDMTGWRVRGKSGAAEILGLKPTTLESRLEKLGIRRPTGAMAS
jgi:formate hydrogenlyase transcriptional activator